MNIAINMRKPIRCDCGREIELANKQQTICNDPFSSCYCSICGKEFESDNKNVEGYW